jgi:hypothetical protein
MIQEIVEWLRSEAEKLMKQGIAREQMAATMQNATRKELRAAMITAEAMNGGKLRGVSSTVTSARRSAMMDRTISEKLISESRQLSTWADYLATLPAPATDRPCTESEVGRDSK